MLKKILAALLVMVFTFSLAACGGEETKEEKKADNASTAQVSSDDTADVGDDDTTETSDGAQDETDKKPEAEGNNNKPDAETSKDSSGDTKPNTNTQTPNNTKPNTNTQTPNTPTTPVRPGSNGGNKPSGGGSTPAKPQGSSTIMVGNWKVKEGKSISQGLDFGGKKYTMAITNTEGQYQTASFKRCIAAFEKEYNCKIELKKLSFDKYNQQVAQANASGNAYDINYAHGSYFPAMAIDKLFEPVTDDLRSADLMDDNDPTAGGIDLAKTSFFGYKGELWGTCNYSSCFPYVMYYNKVALADEGWTGGRDPRKLADNGRWSWDVIKQMGKQMTDTSAGKYFLSNSFSSRGIALSFGAPIVTVDEKGNYRENVSSSGYVAALNLIREFFVGNTRIAEPVDSSHAYNSYDSMLRGQAYMWNEETSKYLDISKSVAKSAAFNRSKSNIGLVKFPLGSTNKKGVYPTGWLTAVCTGKNKDTKVAIAWEVFRSSYKDPVTDSNAMTKEDKAYTDSFMNGDICCEVGKFATSDTDTLRLTEGGIISQVRSGKDVSQSVTSVKDQMTACIKATMK